jgi:hypothetical protein
MQHYTVYFIWNLLYMSRVVPSPIIKNTNNCIYSIWYVSHCYYYLPLSWKIRNCFECAVGGVRHPQHTQNSSDSSMIAADSNNGVTHTSCCRYSCLRFRWWVMVPPETYRAVFRQNKLCNIACCWIYIRILLTMHRPMNIKVPVKFQI